MLESFLKECHKFWYGRIFKSNDFLFSIGIVIISLFLNCKFDIIIDIDYKFITSLLAGIFAFVFTALAIIIWFIDKDFLDKIKWTDIYTNILFTYYFWTSIFLFSILITVLFLIFKINWIFEYIIFFFFIYSISISYEILKTTINLWLYKEKFLINSN